MSWWQLKEYDGALFVYVCACIDVMVSGACVCVGLLVEFGCSGGIWMSFDVEECVGCAVCDGLERCFGVSVVCIMCGIGGVCEVSCLLGMCL